MNILDLKLKGFIGLHKGMGLEEIHLPLGQLAGLVALDGPNGRGKTTILENLQPFRQFASRKGALKKHCFAKDSQKELTLEYNGDIIRTLIKMDAHTTRPDEGFIWVNDKPIVDGKVSSYDKAIKEIFGSSNLFFWSIFCAQNSKRLTDLTTGKMKELFTEFLRLERYALYEDIIKQAVGLVIGLGQGALKTLDHCRNELERYKGVRPDEMLEKATADLKKHQGLVDAKESQIEEVQKEIADKHAEILLNEAANEQMALLSNDLVKSRDMIEALEKEKDEKLAEAGKNFNRVNARMADVKKILEDQEAIRQAAARCMELDAAIVKINGKLEIAVTAHNSSLEEQSKLNARLAKLTTELNTCRNTEMLKAAEGKCKDIELFIEQEEAKTIDKDRTYIQMQAKHSALIQQAQALNEKDQDCISEKCGLIVDATQAAKDAAQLLDDMAKYTVSFTGAQAEQLRVFEVSLKEAQEYWKALQKTAADAEKEISEGLKTIRAQLEAVAEDLERIEDSMEKPRADRKKMQAEFEEITPLATRINDLEMARVSLEGLEEQEQDIKTHLAGVEEDYSARINAEQAVMDLVSARIEKIKINPNAQKEHDDLVTRMGGFKMNRRQYLDWVKQDEKKIDDAKTLMADIVRLKLKKDAAEKEKAQVAGELAQWEYLKDACGKKGLQALEIDAVSPTIEHYANELLISTFGPNNTLRFETQDDEGKEVLNIVVMDPDGSETMLENKSGGEAVWILKSLRLALTLLSKEKSGRNFQTVLMDEEDGALSPANAVKFIGLYRSMMNLGAFDTCYYISHKQEAVGLATHRLIFGENGIDID